LTEEHIFGFEYHIGACLILKEERARCEVFLLPATYRRLDRGHLLEFKTLGPGPITNLGGHPPTLWGPSLQAYAWIIFHEMTDSDQNQSWLAELNCQMFAKKFAHALGLQHNKEAIGETDPGVVDFALCVIMVGMRIGLS